MGFLSNKYFQILLRLIIGGLFVYASVGKLFNQEAFAKAIYNYKLLPGELVNIFAIIMPYVELFSALFLIFGIYKKGSSFLIGMMLIVFIIALTRAYVLGLDISCGCFSLETVSEKSDISQRIIEDILMLIACVMIFFNSDRKFFKNNNKENQQ
jgi:uncharacterized membrane protein YphA (DoxX/SURF4 family)